jgi:hypothetical protein
MIEVRNFDDVGMMDLPGGTSLHAEAFDELGIPGQVGGKEFERYLPAEHHVVRQVHRTHSALAKLADDTVFAANYEARRQIPRLDEHRSIGWAGGVQVRIRRIANRTGLHEAFFLDDG